jgi:hypothetical protein
MALFSFFDFDFLFSSVYRHLGFPTTLSIPSASIILLGLLFPLLYLVLSRSMGSARFQTAQPSTMPAGSDVPTSPEGPSAEFTGSVKVSQKPPTKSELAKVAEFPVIDVNGNSIPFKSLHSDPSNPSKRVLVVFVRHFFCGVSPLPT